MSSSCSILQKTYFSLFQSFLGFGQGADIDIVLDDAATRKQAEIKTEDGKKEKLFLFYDGESITGRVSSTST